MDAVQQSAVLYPKCSDTFWVKSWGTRGGAEEDVVENQNSDIFPSRFAPDTLNPQALLSVVLLKRRECHYTLHYCHPCTSRFS